MVQKVLKENGNTLTVYVMCPGLECKDLVISFDKKNGILDINTKLEENEINSILDLEVKGSIEIPAKFRSEKVSAKVEKGIAVLTFGLAENINLIKCE
jgi:HSP20 family molecular chaperone IbpA